MHPYNQAIYTDKVYKTYWIYPVLVVISFLYLSVFSFATSPLYWDYISDNGTFIMLGKLFLDGRVPYLDYFDHKGPILIFIEALGLSLSSNDRTGIFIVQIIELSITLSFFFHAARCLLSTINSLSVLLIALVFFTFTIEGGNLSEEHSLPFLSLTLWLTIRFWLSPKNRINVLHLLLIGVSGGILFWLRLNNMGVVCACTLFIFIVACKNKDWKGVRQLVLYFGIGFLAVTLPILIYFWINNAVYELIYASFIFNLKYVDTSNTGSLFGSLIGTIIYIFKCWTPFVVLILGTALFYRQHKDYKVVLLSALLFFIGLITTHTGAAYHHYMTLNIPILVFGCIVGLYAIAGSSQKKKLSYFIFLIVFVPASWVCMSRYISLEKSETPPYYIERARDIAAKIPDNERNSVYPYMVLSKFLPSAGLMPYNGIKYFTLQEWHARHEKKILDEINEMMETHPPLWVITEYRDQSKNTRFLEILDEKYIPYYRNHIFELFRLNDGTIKPLQVNDSIE